MADGGSAAVLTADLCARAIIAAARAYGDDPERACTGSGNAKRRALTAAAGGLRNATGADWRVLGRILGMSPGSFMVARSPTRRTDAYTAAETAAERAVRYALWRPEAAASAAPAEGEGVEPGGCEPGEAMAPPEPPLRNPVEHDAPMLTPPPEPASRIPIRTAAPGLTASRRVGQTPPRREPAVRGPETTRSLAAADRPVRDLVLDALADGPRDSMNIAAAIDRKELAVVSALSTLESEGLVASEPLKDGPRRYRWKLTARAAA